MGFQKSQETDVLVNFVLDASSSMHSVAQPTVDGFNEFIQSQVDQAEGNVYVSLTLFNTSFDVRFVARPAAEVPKMVADGYLPLKNDPNTWADGFGRLIGGPETRSINTYRPSGMTALFDGVGVGITGAEEWLRNHPSFNGKVVTVIWTDGGENSSKRHNQAGINELIQTKQNQGWIFQFLGTGSEGWRQNQVFDAIPVSNRGWTSQTGEGMSGGYFAMANTVSNLRSTGGYNFDQKDVSDREAGVR
jgi:hypothetical protein